MSDIPSILDNPDSFYEKVTEILMETNSHSMDLDNWFLNHLKPLLVLNNHNYFFIQILLKKLIKSGDANYNLYALQKVLEMIYKFSNEKSNEDTKFLSDAVRFAKTDQPLHTDLINSLTNIIRSGKLSGGDILKLYRLYKETTPPPDVSFLRAADIMEPLVIHTFAPGHPVSHMDEKIWLIAYAAFFNSSITCPDDIQKGKVTLDELNGFFGRVTSMAQMFDHLPSLLKLTKEPICATAVLLWIKTKLFDDDFYEWTSFSLGETPAAFHVLDEIAVLHPSHRPRVLDIWVSLFERDFDMVTPRLAPLVVIQYREKFLDHFVLLFKYQFEFQVLAYLAAKADTIDPSLIIYFLNQVIPILQMPLDAKLYGVMMHMLRNAPALSINSNPHVIQLLGSGSHITLAEEDARQHEKLEALIT